MSSIIQSMINRPLPTISTTTTVSSGGTLLSFAETSLPVFQLFAAIIAIVSGLIGLAVGIYHLRNTWFKPKV